MIRLSSHRIRQHTAMFAGCSRTAATLAVAALVVTAAAEDSVPFKLVTIDENPPDRPYYKMIADIDADGDLDILIGGAKGSELVCYTYPEWKRSFLVKGGWNGVDGETADIDGDGDLDIVMGGVVWFRNPQIGTGKWKMQKIDDQVAHDIEVADLDGNGRLDVVGRDQSAFSRSDPGGAAVYVYYQTGADQWRRQTIECPHGEGLTLGDVDRDGDADILIGTRWYENAGSRSNIRWTEHVYTESWTEPDAKVEMTDLNQDGRPDIVLTPAELRGERYKVAWYEQPQDPQRGDWTERVVVPSIECVIHSLGVGDFDNDGDTDIAIAEMHQGTDPDEVSIYLNERRGQAWRQQVLSMRGSHDIQVADIGGDGDLDIVGANHSGVAPILLWENLSADGD